MIVRCRALMSKNPSQRGTVVIDFGKSFVSASVDTIGLFRVTLHESE